jgi:hypothetical protein
VKSESVFCSTVLLSEHVVISERSPKTLCTSIFIVGNSLQIKTVLYLISKKKDMVALAVISTVLLVFGLALVYLQTALRSVPVSSPKGEKYLVIVTLASITLGLLFMYLSLF